MAQRFENPLATRLQENAGFEHGRKAGKAMALYGAARPRSTLGQIATNPSVVENLADQAARNNHGFMQLKTAPENLSKENLGRPRALSVEPMEMDMTMSKQSLQLKNVRDIDADDHENPFACAEYANEIYAYLRKREPLFQVSPNYIEKQRQINQRMRAILVDWLVQVHDKFRLLQETLFLTVSFLDRYLATDSFVEKGDLQLVGVTAMFLASKIEEMYTPEISDFVYITDNAYSPAMIRALETKMTKNLDYNFGDPLCIHFLRRYSKAAKADAEKHTMAKYFMELMLPDYESIAFPPSQRAAASLCLAMKITDNSSWNTTLEHYSQYPQASLEPCIKRIAQLLLKAENKQSKLLSVTTKYNRSKFFKIASSPCLSSDCIVPLAQ